MSIRLNKLLAERGLGARRKCDALIKSGVVRVNGKTVTEPGITVEPDRDRVDVNGRLLPSREAPGYFVLHKPIGVISTLSDPEGRRTLRDFLPPGRRVFPVGRLDADTSGLLILTSDGELAHHLMHPRYGVSKLYRVHVDRAPSAEMLRRLREGIEFEPGVRSAPARVRARDASAGESVIELELHEGRYRQVRRMCEAAGLRVLRLHRWGYGPLRLAGLERGLWRELSEQEVRRLRAASARAHPRPPGLGPSSRMRNRPPRGEAVGRRADSHGRGGPPRGTFGSRERDGARGGARGTIDSREHGGARGGARGTFDSREHGGGRGGARGTSGPRERGGARGTPDSRERGGGHGGARGTSGPRERDWARGTFDSRERGGGRGGARGTFDPRERGAGRGDARGKFDPRERGGGRGGARGTSGPGERGGARGTFDPRERGAGRGDARGKFDSREHGAGRSGGRGTFDPRERGGAGPASRPEGRPGNRRGARGRAGPASRPEKRAGNRGGAAGSPRGGARAGVRRGGARPGARAGGARPGARRGAGRPGAGGKPGRARRG